MVDSITAALLLYGGGCFFASFHLGPCHALVQSTAPVRLRGLGVSFLVLTTALIGAGCAPTAVGVLSDALAPRWGEDSLRYAMAWLTLSFLVAVFFLVLGMRHIKRDLEAVEVDAVAPVMDPPG